MNPYVLLLRKKTNKPAYLHASVSYLNLGQVEVRLRLKLFVMFLGLFFHAVAARITRLAGYCYQVALGSWGLRNLQRCFGSGSSDMTYNMDLSILVVIRIFQYSVFLSVHVKISNWISPSFGT